MDDNSLKAFLQYHRINVIDDRKRAYKHTSMNTTYFQPSIDYTSRHAIDALRMETETLYTLEITERELERIAQLESNVLATMKNLGHFNLFESLMAIREEEECMRDKYPAVRKAYEHYSLLLKLAEAGEI